MKTTESHSPKCRVAIVDDHSIVRDGLLRLMSFEDGMEVCWTSANFDDAVDHLRAQVPDVLVTDISLPTRSGLDLVKHVKSHHPECRVLVLSVHDEALYADRAFRAGAEGYIMKDEASENIVRAIYGIHKGGLYMSPTMQRLVLHHFVNSAGESRKSRLSSLTDREYEVLRMIGMGLSTKQIAEQLKRSTKTIDTHRFNLKEKLGMGTMTELTVFAAQWVEGEAAAAGSAPSP